MKKSNGKTVWRQSADATMYMLPRYRELEAETASLSVEQGKKLLFGDDAALSRLHESLASLKEQKKQLLLDAGLPADYLEPLFSCLDCRDTGYIEREKCHCLKQAEISLLYEQSGIQDMLKLWIFSGTPLKPAIVLSKILFQTTVISFFMVQWERENHFSPAVLRKN